MKYTHCIALTSLTASLFIAGCSSQNPAALNNGEERYSLVATHENNSAEDIAKETAAMADAFNFTKSGLGKAQAASELNLQWQSWSYADGWWSRAGSMVLTVLEGSLELQGSDKVQFVNAAGTPVQFPVIQEATGGSIIHNASMHLQGLNGGYVDALRNWSLSGSVTKAADTSLTLNGSLTQSLRAENSDQSAWCNFGGTATVTNVVCRWTNGGWSTPVSGSISLESPYKTIAITFEQGVAIINISDKNGTLVVSNKRVTL